MRFRRGLRALPNALAQQEQKAETASRLRHFVMSAAATGALAAAGVGLMPAVAHAATTNTYFVGNAGDSTAAVTPATCMDSTNTTCTFRDAVNAANSDGGGTTDTIVFTSLPSPSTIQLTPGNGPVDISDAGTVVVQGQGVTKTLIDGGAGTEVIDATGNDVTLSGLTIQNGSNTNGGGGLYNDGTLTLTNVNFVNDASTNSQDGGGIYNDGTATATNVTLTANTAYDGAAIYNDGTFNATNLVATGNTASRNGGGIYDDGTLTITGGSLSNNTASSDCGGALEENGTATLNQLTVANNNSDCGGGFDIRSGAMVSLSNSTLSGNFVRDYDDGGAIENLGTLDATNDTITGNTSLEYGGGIANDNSNAKATLINDTIANNNALQAGGGVYQDSTGANTYMNIQGSVLDGNVVYNAANQCFGYGPITSLGYNVVGPQNDTTCAFTATGDETNTSALLGPLGNNGGPTPTMALNPSSPALHLEPLAMCPGTDQRGTTRPQPASATTCDAGAFELVSQPVTNPTTGYWMVGSDGGVFAFGNAPYVGSLPGINVHVNNIVGIVGTHDRLGYWMVGRDGGVFAFGDAKYVGSLPGIGVHVNNIVGIVGTHDGLGYWMIGSDGGVFAFGDAPYVGSLPGIGVHVNNIVGIVGTHDGLGYWVVGSDGGVFAFGDAPYTGSLPGIGVHVNDVVGIVGTHDQRGYWMVGRDGGAFAFGDAPYVGSIPGLGLKVTNVVGIVGTASGAGYWMVGNDGGVFAFGDAGFVGSLPGIGVHVKNIVGIVGTT